MECIYKFRVNKPSDKISVIIDQSDKEGKLLYASQDGIETVSYTHLRAHETPKHLLCRLMI